MALRMCDDVAGCSPVSASNEAHFFLIGPAGATILYIILLSLWLNLAV